MRLDAPIRELVFCDGQRMTLNRDSIVVFVGPNNAGKTSCLRDIYALLSDEPHLGLIESINFEKPPISDIKALLGEASVKVQDPSLHYDGMGFKVYAYHLDRYDERNVYPEPVREMLFHFLTTDTRLSACNPEQSISRTDAAAGPISMLVRDASHLEKVSAAFHSAFALDVTPNYFAGGNVPLCLGPTPTTPEGMTAPQMNEYMYELMSTYQLAHLQGDGMRSFLGIMLYLYVDHFAGLFIDEPESFLHPPQAALMGSLIASDETSNHQLFLSTHSKDFLNGLLDSDSGRVCVVRITRTGTENFFAPLGADDVASLSSTTLLKYSDLVNALFHERTVLCESDSDCMFYQAIWDSAMDGEPTPLFLPVGGKARFKIFAGLLSKLSIDYAVIADADILKEPGDFKELLSMGGSDWSAVKDDWTVVRNELGGDDDGPSVAGLRAEIDDILNACKGNRVSKNSCAKIESLLESRSRWDELKRHGKRALSGSDAFEAYERMERKFSTCGVYIVPLGELECFVPSITQHGPSWVAEVFQRYPDLNDSAYEEAKKFIMSIGGGCVPIVPSSDFSRRAGARGAC